MRGKTAKFRLDAHVDGQAALDHLHDLPVDRRALHVGPRDDVPDLDLVGLLLGEDDEALGVFLGLEVDLDLLADLGRDPAPVELVDRDRALALVADVDNDLAFLQVLQALLLHIFDLVLLGLGGAPARNGPRRRRPVRRCHRALPHLPRGCSGPGTPAVPPRRAGLGILCELVHSCCSSVQ